MLRDLLLYLSLFWASKQCRKLCLRGNKSFKEGAFGLPWFQCTNSEVKTEGFWGIDHLGVVADFLGLDRSRDSGFRALL
ncbi:hypothetical protein N7450_006652 [Penicillium hetheringtonii]|uniref:Secreted protein n=1 Tax=Penicillium hetheringtonii TaxID=911720 RepID=A0AAD6DG92_9EURO|nr:hypothetical protein N7450_006652 [Penicillium hetheringtonii]